MREMKDSGIEWIGEIPADWELSKIGAVYEERNESVSDVDFPPLSVTKQGVVPQLETAAKTNDGDNRKLIRKNDFVINNRSDRRGSCGISEYDGSCSLINTVLKPRRNMCNAYYSFVFRSERFADEFYRWGNGIVDDLWSTKWSNMKRIYIPAPSLQEQRRIADYLDRKCSRIDTIIARQQEVIDKLKAYKLSVITEAVTKGLNPDVPMKDSGVEWIGAIPEHWKVCRLKNILQQIKNAVKVGPFGSQLKTNDYVDAGYWVYTQRTVLDKNFDSNDTFISCEKYRDMEGFKVEADDILITTRGTGTTGHIAKVPPKFYEGILHPCLMRIKLDESICKYDYLFYLFEYAAFIRNQIDFASNTSSLPVLYSYTLNNIWITLPSVNEQLQIATALNEVSAKIDNIIIKRQQVIDSLIDYKKSLIYEVVTGKKEV